jgi:hypothetical protein
MADLAADGGEAGIEYEDLDGPCHETQSNGSDLHPCQAKSTWFRNPLEHFLVSTRTWISISPLKAACKRFPAIHFTT